jgi:hypothetical protein
MDIRDEVHGCTHWHWNAVQQRTSLISHVPNACWRETLYVLQHRAAAYAFVPRGEPPVGGDLYVLTYNARYAGDPDNEYLYEIWYAGGRFHSSSGEEDYYTPDDLPDEVRSLTFTPSAPSFDHVHHMDYELQIVLRLLEGASLEDARRDA